MKRIRNIFSVLLLGISLMMVSAPGFSADFQKGLDAYNLGDYQAALREWRPLAKQGNADAQNNLGRMYKDGRGVAQSHTEAVKWFRKSAEQGNADAQNNLGRMYEDGRGAAQSHTEAVKWFRKSAEQGRAAGQNSLGWMYDHGLGVAQSHTEAVQWYRKAAEQDNADAQTNLGWMYEHGRGVAQSHTEALQWYRKAAEQGDATGQRYLGRMYRWGRGVVQSLTEAVKWYRKAAEQGDATALRHLGWMYDAGLGVAQSDTEMVKWYRKAAEQGDRIAQNSLGLIFEHGRGVTQSYTEAVKWYRKSAEQGDEWSQNRLKKMGIDWTKRQIAKVEPKAVKPANQVNADESERVKELEKRLALLEAQTKQTEQAIASDTQPPSLRILGKYTEDESGVFEGSVTDNVEVAELLVNGRPIAFDSSGRFTHKEYLPLGGSELTIVAIDRAGLKSTETVRLNREAPKQIAKVSFDSLNPTTRYVKSNGNAIALVVGVADYEKTTGAEYADRDAQVFYDYARLKLGIPKERIQMLINDKADVVGMLSGINKWLKRSVKQGQSDVYIFFAGHGLASDDGGTAYLIPYDGAPDFLERTAISRDEVFLEVSSVNPRSVTVFLDTCYSGDTRGETRLIDGRPLNIKLQEQSLPEGFTVLTAAGGDQIAKPLKEAQHGMFSYFLMKGMEGDADSNYDNAITARELHAFVKQNVIQQSGGSQVPELQGDAERVLVRFR
tara:strand:- start:1519 stop:3687 length:2169 start_codon:yes stop_codon:yes gene_type:complete